ncbi:PREDICTED: interferon-induced helicase C domain-containing protein 1-like [Calidris pugnax]|uniref:interferon-induced helicase C domain-containing protein 1-like n=1 Tax=Calidris pugnax TaxID=198806 RepID=UPI00071D25BB|nr:PREDICTED: interferon-induced helicase C domain-containing protein 1-like [Calidris pugnax]
MTSTTRLKPHLRQRLSQQSQTIHNPLWEVYGRHDSLLLCMRGAILQTGGKEKKAQKQSLKDTPKVNLYNIQVGFAAPMAFCGPPRAPGAPTASSLRRCVRGKCRDRPAPEPRELPRAGTENESGFGAAIKRGRARAGGEVGARERRGADSEPHPCLRSPSVEPAATAPPALLPQQRHPGAPAMAEECRDERFLYMISCFRPRLKQVIRVQPVLDLLPSLSAEEREKVRAAAERRGEVEGAEELLRAVERGPRGCGWFHEFLQALENGGCSLAACYLNPSLSLLPSPAEEADHDLCVHLVQLLHGTLVDKMLPRPVAEKCLEMGIFQEDDLDRIHTVTDNRGNRDGARELLSRIVQKKDWFSPFLVALRETEHGNLADDLNGITGGTENRQNGMNNTNEETEVTSQPGHAAVEDLKQQENVNDGFSSENTALETSIGNNSVVPGSH